MSITLEQFVESENVRLITSLDDYSINLVLSYLCNHEHTYDLDNFSQQIFALLILKSEATLGL